MSSERIQKLCEYIKINNAKNYPIMNSFLSDSTDFIINGYLKMLGVILQQAGEITDDQYSLLNRIIAGIETDVEIGDYLRQALDIEIEEYLNFTSECKELPVKFRFVFDAMILICSKNRNEDQLKLLASFCEVFELSKDEVSYLATMARAILEINLTAYVDAEMIKIETVPEDTFNGYIRLLATECIYSNSELTIFQPTSTVDVTVIKLEQIKYVETPCIKLVKVEVNLEEFPLSFKNKKKVVMEGCNFIGGNKYPICFENCDEVVISNCSIEKFNKFAIKIERVGMLKIINTKFMDCIYKYTNSSNDWIALGAIIHSETPSVNGRIFIDGSDFENCGGINTENYYRSAFISNCTSDVNNSKFKNCWHKSNGSKIDPDNEKRTMFTKDSKAIRCEFDNSAKFC